MKFYAESRQWLKVKKMLEHGESPYLESAAVIYAAAEQGMTGMLKYIKEHYSDVICENIKPGGTIEVSLKKKQFDTALYLIDQYIELTKKTRSNPIPYFASYMHRCVLYDCMPGVIRFIEGGYSLLAEDKNASYPWAQRILESNRLKDKVQAIESLKPYGFNFQSHYAIEEKRNLLVLAIEHKNTEVLDYFLSSGLDYKSHDSHAVKEAIKRKSLRCLNVMEKHGLDLKENLALYADYAVRHNAVSIFIYLETLGLDIHVEKSLFKASQYKKSVDVMTYLLKHSSMEEVREASENPANRPILLNYLFSEELESGSRINKKNKI